MRTRAPIQLTVQFPESGEDRRELARRVSEVHADWVIGTLSKLDCPARQREELLQAVIDTARGVSPPRSDPEKVLPHPGTNL